MSRTQNKRSIEMESDLSKTRKIPFPSYSRLLAVSLSSWSVEQNARDTQMTTHVA